VAVELCRGTGIQYRAFELLAGHGLLVLSKILLGGFRMRPGGSWSGYRSKWRNKWGKMSDEERDRFKEEWKQRCQERKKYGGK